MGASDALVPVASSGAGSGGVVGAGDTAGSASSSSVTHGSSGLLGDVLGGTVGAAAGGAVRVAVVRYGWLRKLGATSLSRWKRRWFVLSEQRGSVSYYTSKLQQTPRGVIPLAFTEVRRQPGRNETYQRIVGSTRKTLVAYCFCIEAASRGASAARRGGGRAYYLYTDTRQSMDQWIDAIATVRDSAEARLAQTLGVTSKLRGSKGQAKAEAAGAAVASSLDIATNASDYPSVDWQG